MIFFGLKFTIVTSGGISCGAKTRSGLVHVAFPDCSPDPREIMGEHKSRHGLKPRKMTLSEVDQKIKKRSKNDIFWIKIHDCDLWGH